MRKWRRRTDRRCFNPERPKAAAACTSGYTRVYQNRKTRKWTAQITFQKKTYYLGSYEKIEDAVKACRRGEEMHDEFLEWYFKAYGQNSSAGK